MFNLLPAGTKKVIVAPLNWGLGHACRSIPIIQNLLDHDLEVVLASDGEALELLQDTFPELKSEKLPGYYVRYKGTSLWSIVVRNAFRVFRAIVKESNQVDLLVEKHKADLVISDSRFGFRSKKCHNIIISHQLNMQARNSLLNWFMNRANRIFLSRFNQIWVPDFEDRRLSGVLSQENHFDNVRYIGPQSNLKKKNLPKKFDLAIILSGPEPARTRLEESLIEKHQSSDLDIVLVRGTNEASKLVSPDQWTVYDRVGREIIEDILQSSEKIISRSGYTSIMDYYLLGVEASLIPTPGQSEQEYLAEYLDGKYRMSSYS